MESYLSADNPEVNRIITDIVTEIVSHFHPRSIIMAGGFGRREGSVFEENGKLKFLSDCEITMMSAKDASREAIGKLSAELYQRTGLEIVLHDSVMLRVITLFPWLNKVLGKAWRPSIHHYDLKHSSLVLYGQNIIKNIPDVSAQDIPLWEGIRLMLNRMAEALKYFPLDNKKRDETIYWTNKVVIACQDALLLSVKKYHSSYKSRNLMFQELLPEQFGKLNQRLPKFLSLASRATDYKLKPSRGAYSEDLLELWFDTLEICDQVFRYVVQKDVNITFDSYAEFQQKYMVSPKLKGEYYLDSISFMKFKNNVATHRKHVVYSIIPEVYFACSREGKIDNLSLKHARNIISMFKKMAPTVEEPVKEWSYIKDETVKLWYTLFIH